MKLSRKTSAFHTVVVIGGEAGAALGGFLFTLVATKAVGLREYGYFGLALATVATVLVLLDIRLEDVVARRAQHDLDEHRTESWSGYVWGDAFFGIVRFALVTGVVLVVPALRSSVLGPLVVVVAVGSLVGTADSSLVAVLNVLGRRAPMAMTRMTPGTVRLALALAVQPQSAMALAVIYVCGSVVASALLWASLSSILRKPHGVIQFLRSWHEWRKEVLMLSVASTVRAPAAHIDQLVVGAVLGPLSAGVYRLARSLSSLPGVLAAAMRLVHVPRILSAADRRDTAALQRLLGRLTAASLAVGVLATVAWVAYGRLFLEKILGDGFQSVYAPAIVLLLGACAEYATSWSKVLPIAVRRPRWALFESIAYTTSLPLAAYLGARAGGVVGTAIAVALVSLAASIGWVVVVLRRVPTALLSVDPTPVVSPGQG